MRSAMMAAGIEPPAELIADGTVRRFDVPGDKTQSKNGWYVLFSDPPAGAFGCWKRGIRETWRGQSLDEKSRAEIRDAIAKSRVSRLAAETAAKMACRERAAEIWKASIPCGDNPYLAKKGVHGYGVRAHCGAVVVPVRDTAGTLHGLQFISADGTKKFLTGTAKRGCYHAIGKIKGRLYICEGYATGASIHEATGHAVAVAFDAGNLKPTAEQLRRKYPAMKLVICADNDQWTEGNPGLTKAKEAASAAGASVIFPAFKDLESKPTDFNDMAALSGLDVLRMALESWNDEETHA